MMSGASGNAIGHGEHRRKAPTDGSLRMTRTRLVIGAVVLLLLAALGFMWASSRTPRVEILTVQRADAVRALAANGRIRPRQSVEIRAQVAGNVLDLPYNVGDRVVAGAIIARLDDGPQRAAVAEAGAAAAAQEAVLAQARRDLTRFSSLGEFVTRQRVEQARLSVDQGTRDLQRLRASRAQALELQARFAVRAPFAGVILDRPVDPGQTVGLDTTLYRLANLTAPEITAEVDEVYAAALRTGTIGLVELAGYERQLRAEIIHIEPRVDEATGAREVRLRFVDPLDVAPAGQTVSINFVVERRAHAISIPRSAILTPDSNPHVRIVDKDGRVADRPIAFVDWPTATVIVTEGLEPGLRLLANPNAAQPGTRVEAKR